MVKSQNKRARWRTVTFNNGGHKIQVSQKSFNSIIVTSKILGEVNKLDDVQQIIDPAEVCETGLSVLES